MAKNTRKQITVPTLQLTSFDPDDSNFETTRQSYRDFYDKVKGIMDQPELSKVGRLFNSNVVGYWYETKSVAKIIYQREMADDLSRNADLSDPYRQDLHEALNAEQWNADSYKPQRLDGVHPHWYQAYYGAKLALDFFGCPAACNIQPKELAWMFGNGQVEGFTIQNIINQAAVKVGVDINEGRIGPDDTVAQEELRKLYIRQYLTAAEQEAQFRRANVLKAWNYMCDEDGESDALAALANGYDGTPYNELRDQYILGISNFICKKLNEAKLVVTSSLKHCLVPHLVERRTQLLQYIDDTMREHVGDPAILNPHFQAVNSVVERLKKMPLPTNL